MSIFAGEIAKCMERLAPVSLAEHWDNVGLLLGSADSKVRKLMISLDITSQVVSEAIKSGADMIVTHHPLIFRGIMRLNPDDPKARLILELIKKDICVYSAHTNLDIAEGGLNEYLACALGLTAVSNMNRPVSDKLYGLGKAGVLEKSLSPEEFLSRVKYVLSAQRLRVIGKLPDIIKKVAVFSGSFDENYAGLQSSDIDVLVTGDVKYHTAIDISELGLCVIDAGHYNTERIVVDMLAAYLSKEFPEILVSGSGEERDPYSYY